jgi:hypothetical protein
MTSLQAEPGAERPKEQLPVPLFDGVVLAARGSDALIYLALRDLCEVLGLEVTRQRRRIVADDSLHLRPFRVQVDRQFRTMDFLLLDDVPIWIMSVQTRRVAPETQERFAYVKQYLTTAVRSAFARLTGLPDAPSHQIEDLHDLDRIDSALTALQRAGETLNVRQDALEGRQDRAARAFRQLEAAIADLRDRLSQIERQLPARLTPQQRNTIYRMVQAWGQARSTRDTRLTPGAAIRKAWIEVNARFGVTNYADLPAGQYVEIVQFIQQQYRALTGQDLDAAEQQGLDM